MTERELLQELGRLAALPSTKEDWRDLYETIEAYRTRCLARAIAKSAHRDAIIAAIQQRAEAE